MSNAEIAEIVTLACRHQTTRELHILWLNAILNGDRLRAPIYRRALDARST